MKCIIMRYSLVSFNAGLTGDAISPKSSLDESGEKHQFVVMERGGPGVPLTLFNSW